MAKEATKPQTKHADRMTLPKSSQITHKHTLEYVGVEKEITEKVGFSFLFLILTSQQGKMPLPILRLFP